jgi:hypothetical protein
MSYGVKDPRCVVDAAVFEAAPQPRLAFHPLAQFVGGVEVDTIEHPGQVSVEGCLLVRRQRKICHRRLFVWVPVHGMAQA